VELAAAIDVMWRFSEALQQLERDPIGIPHIAGSVNGFP
jgi:hypothetical protein